MANLGPISTRVGAEDRWQNAQIAFVDGEQGPPIQLLKRGVASYLDLHVNGTLSYTQPAGATAVTGNGLFPWGLARQWQTDVGANTKFNQNIGGYDLYCVESYLHPAYTPTYTAPLPPANSGGSPASGTLTWDWRQRLPISVSENDLTGMILLGRQDAETVVQAYWRSVASLLNLGTGASATFTGAVNLTVYGYQIGQLKPADLALAHVLQAVPVNLPTTTSYDYQLLLNRQIIRIFFIPYVNGIPDTTGQVSLESMNLQIGDARPVSISASELQFANKLHARGSVPPGVLVLDRSRNAPTQYLNLNNVNQAFVNMLFNSACPSGASYNVVYQYLR